MRENYGTKLDVELKKALIKLSDDTRIPASRLLDEAITDLLEKYSKLNFPKIKK